MRTRPRFILSLGVISVAAALTAAAIYFTPARAAVKYACRDCGPSAIHIYGCGDCPPAFFLGDVGSPERQFCTYVSCTPNQNNTVICNYICSPS